MALWLVIVATACSTPTQTPEPVNVAPAVDTNEIVQAVWVRVQARMEQERDLASPTSTADVPDEEEIVQAVMAQVETRLAQQSTTPPRPIAVAGDVLEQSLIEVYRLANPAVVYIVVPSVGSGSGFVYSDQGYIVTNNHVVEGARSFEVVFFNGERRRARLVGTDADSDLAVVAVDALPDGVRPLPLAEPAAIQVGQFVIAIGNPFGEQGSMSLGIVSGLGRSLPSQRGSTTGSTYSLPQVIQTDAPINPGNSGGPLLNLDGEVVGVNAAIASTTGTNSGVGFSIRVDAVHLVVPSIIQNGEYAYPYMGMSFKPEITLDERDALGLSQTTGAYVVSVAPGGPAARAGLLAADAVTGRGGDLVTAIDGQPVADFSDLNSYLVFHTSVGQTIDLTLLRQGETMHLSLTLGARP